MINPRSLALTPLLASLIATAALVACNRAEEPRTAGQVLDQAVTEVQKKAKEIGDDMREGSAKAATTVAAAGTKSADAVRDAAITVEVKAMLAKDPDLRALRIDVDTTAGRVALRGTAPTAAARERASQLAKAVTGVTGVNNELSVKTNS